MKDRMAEILDSQGQGVGRAAYRVLEKASAPALPTPSKYGEMSLVEAIRELNVPIKNLRAEQEKLQRRFRRCFWPGVALVSYSLYRAFSPSFLDIEIPSLDSFTLLAASIVGNGLMLYSVYPTLRFIDQHLAKR